MEDTSVETSAENLQESSEEPNANMFEDSINELDSKIEKMEQSISKLNQAVALFVEKGGVIHENNVTQTNTDEDKEEYIPLDMLDYTI